MAGLADGVRTEEGQAIAFCLGREEGTLPFGAAEADRLVHRRVQATMANFGSSLLTRREREVVFYMLSGYSSEQTAERLKTAEGTIRNQRKSIHRKLETGSQAELFPLFIQCIAYADPDSDADPLVRFQGPAAARR